MKLTIEVEPDVLKRAGLRAVAECTSVGVVLREHLAAYADGHRFLRRVADETTRSRSEAMASLIRLSQIPRPVATPLRTTRSRRGGRNWMRDDLYDR